MTLLYRLMRWAFGRKLMPHEELTERYRAIRGKSVQDYETEILERLYGYSNEVSKR